MANELNSNQIAQILPHRFPFALVDRITDYEPGQWAKGRKCVSVNEQFFCGHFPQEHVMPGVLILEAMAQVGAVAILSLPENQGKIASPMRRSALRPQSFRQRMAVLHLLHPKILSCTHQLHGGTVACACAPGHGPSLQQQRLLDFCCGTG